MRRTEDATLQHDVNEMINRLQLYNICFLLYNFFLVIYRPSDTFNSISDFHRSILWPLIQSETFLESRSIFNILYKTQPDT